MANCNCKTINNGDDINNLVQTKIKTVKLNFWDKCVIIYNFIEFYMFFVISSILNFIIKDRLEPSIPKKLIRKYSRL